MESSKEIGIAICIVGSILALLIVPVKFLGIGDGWHFVFGDAGLGVKNYQIIDDTLLLIELLVINGVGLGIYFLGRQQGRDTEKSKREDS